MSEQVNIIINYDADDAQGSYSNWLSMSGGQAIVWARVNQLQIPGEQS